MSKDFKSLIETMDNDTYQRLKTAVEIGRWADGRGLSEQQRQVSLQAVIAYELKNDFAEEHRTGFVQTQGSNCGVDSDDVKEQISPLKWQ